MGVWRGADESGGVLIELRLRSKFEVLIWAIVVKMAWSEMCCVGIECIDRFRCCLTLIT